MSIVTYFKSKILGRFNSKDELPPDDAEILAEIEEYIEETEGKVCPTKEECGSCSCFSDERLSAVILLDRGDKPVNVIKKVREVTGFGLKEAKELVDNTPSLVKRGLTDDDAIVLASSLGAAGGIANMIPDTDEDIETTLRAFGVKRPSTLGDLIKQQMGGD